MVQHGDFARIDVESGYAKSRIAEEQR
jgi:hypothetical protein